MLSSDKGKTLQNLRETTMTKIKICGLTRIEDIEAVNSCLPDYIGFVLRIAAGR